MVFHMQISFLALSCGLVLASNCGSVLASNCGSVLALSCGSVVATVCGQKYSSLHDVTVTPFKTVYFQIFCKNYCRFLLS